MAQITKSITVDVAKRNLFQAIIAKQLDSNSRFLKVTLVNEGEIINIDSTSVVTINAERADGISKSFIGKINDDGTVTVPLAAWMLELDDRVICDISIVDVDGNKLTTTSFELEVEAAAYNGEEIEDDENNDLLVSLLTALANKADTSDVEAALADKADTEDVYSINEADEIFLSKWEAEQDYAKNISLENKADKNSVYTKAEVDTAIANKADTSDIESALAEKADKVEVENSLAEKANKTEVDESLSEKEAIDNKISDKRFITDSKTNYPSIAFLEGYYYNVDEIDTLLDGKDISTDTGTASITHTWDGTILTITTDSGTSSADLKGEQGIQGEKGETGADGKDGIDGYTPVKGTDYWTEVDKSEIIGEVNETVSQQLAELTQVEPNFANSIDECTDTAKVYVLPDGYVYAYMFNEGSGTTANFTNQISISTDTDGSIYNDIGYATDSYLSSSSGSPSTKVGSVASGFIPYTTDKNLYYKGVDLATTNTYTRICYYNSSKTLLGYSGQNNLDTDPKYLNNNFTIVAEGDYFKMTPNNVATNFPDTAYIRISCGLGITGDEWIVTVNQPITYTVDESGYSWENTGHAFVSADYEDRVIALETDSVDHESRIADVEKAITEINNEISEDDAIPEYWLSELELKADAICLALETAGRNKSAFLWYTDAHWTYGNTKVSPMILKYLWENTPMNKVNFGGDIVVNAQDRTNMKFLYNEWRNAIRELPNHHSVVGNHDIMVDYPYSFLIAPEESADMVMGNGMYYYIDNPCEKTRYLYLEYLTNSDTDAVLAQATFIADALISTPDAWHIVAISHRWFQYTTTDVPTVGAIPNYIGDMLRAFDAYNSRLEYSGSTYFPSQDFTGCGGKVEFCIGGHIHVDYDMTYTGGIPIIHTASDTNINRSPDETEDSGTLGTVTESAVYGIIADYDNSKITIVGVGRGGSREISI